jgi:hypothetical protein
LICAIAATEYDLRSGTEMNSDTLPRRDAASWLRLKAFLAGLRPGDVITARHTVEHTHVAPESVDVVLSALTRANLFEQHGEYFVRCQIDLASPNELGE